MDSLTELDRQLHKNGHYCVYVFTFPEEVALKIEWIVEMKKKHIPVYFFSNKMIQSIQLMRKIVKQHQISVVHTHFLTGNQFLLCKISACGLHIDIVVHYHNHAKPSQNIVKKIIRRTIYNRSNMVGVSESVTIGLEEIFPNNHCYRVDNAIDFNRLENYTTLDIKKDADVRTCLIFGFDFERKGVDLAINAINQLIDEGENIILLISLSKNEDEIKIKVKNMLGEIPQWIFFLKARNDVATYYRAADIFLSPSREEGFCYSVVEAAYCGCSIVASKIPAQKDLKVPFVVWFDSENVEQMKNAIRCANKRDKRDVIQIKKMLQEEYDLKKWARKVIDIYEEM